MNNTQFMRLMEATFTRLKDLTNTKGREYSGDEDRCRNFKQEGEELGLHPAAILGVYMAKHYSAVKTHIKDLQKGIERDMSEPIEGRIDDMILYLILLKALLFDLNKTDISFENAKMRDAYFVDEDDGD